MRKKKRMRPQSCKSKGRRLQQRVASGIRAAFPHLGDGDAVSTSMGAPGEDVRMSPAARACIPLSIECKCVERLNVWACLDQAVANTAPDAHPCLIFSKNRSRTWACVPWEVLLDLYRARGAAGDPASERRVRQLVQELHGLLGGEPAAPSSQVTPDERDEDSE